MTRRFLLIVLAVLALGLPAAAGEQSSEQEPVTWEDLLALVEAEIDLLEGAGLLPGKDLTARMGARLARLDLFIGSVRVAAERLLADEVGGRVAPVVVDLPGDIDLAGIASTLLDAAVDPVTTWRAERLAPEWVTVAEALDRLRVVAGERTPTRVCPAQGDVWFVDDWAVDRPRGREHKGIDLMGPRGLPVQAIEDGVVIQANWHFLGGKQIWMRADSTGDVWYYAHLDTWEKWIWTGTRIEAGDVMGTLGSSGNAHGPVLHMGWMPASGVVDLDNLQNPYPILREICEWNQPPSWYRFSD